MKAIVICKETLAGPTKGAPDLTTPYSGFVYVGNLPGAYAIYIITATGAQLTAIQAEPNCVGGALITEDGVKWSQMNEPISAGLRTKINTFRANNGQTAIPADTTLLQVVRFAAAHFDGLGNFDVFDGDLT